MASVATDGLDVQRCLPRWGPLWVLNSTAASATTPAHACVEIRGPCGAIPMAASGTRYAGGTALALGLCGVQTNALTGPLPALDVLRVRSDEFERMFAWSHRGVGKLHRAVRPSCR